MCRSVEGIIQYWQIWKIIGFLKTETMVEVEIRWFDMPRTTFLPGVCIDHGKLCVDPWNVHPGDLLHEAGHIVTVPLELRPYLDGQIGADETFNNAVVEYMQKQGDVEFNKLAHLSDDGAAGYWSYLALKHLELPEELAFEQYPQEAGCKPLDVIKSAEALNVPTHFSASLFYAGLFRTRLGPLLAWDIALLEDAQCLQLQE